MVGLRVGLQGLGIVHQRPVRVKSPRSSTNYWVTRVIRASSRSSRDIQNCGRRGFVTTPDRPAKNLFFS